jgi:quercetin dioxygenase-like cupin family protein
VRASTHEGEEFIYVLSGEVEVLYGKDMYRLKTGDCIYYDSIVPHHVHSAGAAEARVLAVVYAP